MLYQRYLVILGNNRITLSSHRYPFQFDYVSMTFYNVNMYITIKRKITFVNVESFDQMIYRASIMYDLLSEIKLTKYSIIYYIINLTFQFFWNVNSYCYDNYLFYCQQTK